MRSAPQSTWESGLRPDIVRARALAKRLCDAYYSGAGIHGETVSISAEKTRPCSTKAGSRGHLLYIALTSSADRLRDSDELWQRSRNAKDSSKYSYLFDPDKVARSEITKVEVELLEQVIAGARFPKKDVEAWYRICKTLSSKWQGDVRNFLQSCGYYAPLILSRLKSTTQGVPDFPLLKGAKIGPMFVRFLRDWAQVELKSLRGVDVPVDVMLLQATLCAGVLRGTYEGRRGPLCRDVQKIWREATRGLVTAKGELMVPLDVDAALWRVGRHSCAHRSVQCPCSPGCVGATINEDKKQGTWYVKTG